MSPDRLSSKIKNHCLKPGGPYLIKVGDTYGLYMMVRVVFFALAGRHAEIVHREFTNDCVNLGLNAAINNIKMASKIGLNEWECYFLPWMEDVLRTYYQEAMDGNGPLFPINQIPEPGRN